MLSDAHLSALRALPGGKPRILALADLIESLPHTRKAGGFNMNYFLHLCGSPSCIMGWASFIWGNPEAPDYGTELDGMRCLLGHPDLSSEEREAAHDLAYGTEDLDLLSITPAHAAATLRHYAETGEVDWSAPSSQESA